ncbi:hypothetical protein FRC04_010928 [Tulasnella sp. 424]|nr:hypothetical protein FRC04_010928 [Tulasnella sp. 424]KAG8975713.1 hypothetical protein FRC05_005231 [Tulasnella sp. 425]
MHPSLEVPDILCLIFKCDLTERDLFNCSLVCRVWGIWAPDVLWSTCPVPLQGALRLLYSAEKTSVVWDGQNILFLRIGDIEEFHWRRFLARSNKIKRVTVDCKLTRASLNKIKLAKKTFHGEPFGQLDTVKTNRGYVAYETIRLLTAPPLTRVFLSSTPLLEDGARWVANNMPVIAPNITHLQISLSWRDHRPELSRHLALKYLELCYTEVRPHLWESLASCQLLRKIVLAACWHSVALDDSSGWRADFVHFPALRTLNMRAGSPELMLKLISRSRMPILEDLWWDLKSWHVTDGWLDQMVTRLKLYSPRLDTDKLYHMGPGGHSESPYIEIGNIDESGWRQFLDLSNRITTVIIDCGLGEAGLKHIKLANQKFNGEPFTHLEALQMEVDDGQHKTLRLVTAPSLTSVVLLSSHILPEDTLDWVANGMPEIAPNITHLEIPLNSRQIIEISRYTALQHLKLRSVEMKPRLWESLACCKRLTKIVLMSCRKWDDGSDWRLDTVHFPALHTLKIECGHPRVLSNLIARSRMPVLECLRWDEYGRPAKDQIDHMAAQLKLYSPKLETDTLYRNDTAAHGDDPLDSDSDNSGW